MKIKPRKNNVVIEPLTEDVVKQGGIIIPQRQDKEVPDKGKIYAAGPDSDLKKGDEVIFNKFSSKDFKIDQKTYYICTDDDVLAVLG